MAWDVFSMAHTLNIVEPNCLMLQNVSKTLITILNEQTSDIKHMYYKSSQIQALIQ